MNSLQAEFETTSMAAERPSSRLAQFQSPGQILALGLALGVLADLLVFGKPLGIGFLILVLLLVGVLWRVNRLEGKTAVRQNLWLLVPLLFFASMIFLRANTFLTTMNTLAVLCLLVYLVFFWNDGRAHNLGLIDMALLPLRVGGHSFILAPSVTSESVDLETAKRHGRRNFLPILRGLLLAAPVLLIFTLLLAAADTIFKQTVQNTLSLDIFMHLFDWTGHAIFMVTAAWLVTGGLAYSVWRHGRDDQSQFEATLQRLPTVFSLGYIEMMTLLITINALFFVFVLIQFRYLFGGAEYLQIEAFSYAEYARQGFFELLAVSVLSITMILGLNWLTRRESKRQIRWFNLLSSLLLSFVLVMLVSAFWRMRLYESTFGYTQLRLNVFVFIIWLAVLLVWFLITLWGQHHFAIGALVAAMGFLVTLNLLNPDAFIARQNLVHYITTGNLDAAYLTTLSDDALPQLLQALSLTQEDTETQLIPACDFYQFSRIRMDDCYATPYEIVQTEVDGRYQSMNENSHWRQWPSFHLARWKAFTRLQLWAESESSE